MVLTLSIYLEILLVVGTSFVYSSAFFSVTLLAAVGTKLVEICIFNLSILDSFCYQMGQQLLTKTNNYQTNYFTVEKQIIYLNYVNVENISLKLNVHEMKFLQDALTSKNMVRYFREIPEKVLFEHQKQQK